MVKQVWLPQMSETQLLVHFTAAGLMIIESQTNVTKTRVAITASGVM